MGNKTDLFNAAFCVENYFVDRFDHIPGEIRQRFCNTSYHLLLFHNMGYLLLAVVKGFPDRRLSPNYADRGLLGAVFSLSF